MYSIFFVFLPQFLVLKRGRNSASPPHQPQSIIISSQYFHRLSSYPPKSCLSIHCLAATVGGNQTKTTPKGFMDFVGLEDWDCLPVKGWFPLRGAKVTVHSLCVRGILSLCALIAVSGCWHFERKHFSTSQLGSAFYLQRFHSFVSSCDHDHSEKQQVCRRTYVQSFFQFNTKAGTTLWSVQVFLEMNTRKSTGWLLLQPPSPLSTGISVDRLSEPASARLISRLNKIPNWNFGSLDCKLDVRSGMWTKQHFGFSTHRH